MLDQLPAPIDYLINFNIVPTIFHNDNIYQGLWKIIITTFQCIVDLQLLGEGPAKLDNYETDWSCTFSTFEDLITVIFYKPGNSC